MAYSKFSDQSEAEMTSRIMMITQVARTVSTATSCSVKGQRIFLFPVRKAEKVVRGQ